MRITDRFSSEHDVFLAQLEVIDDLTRRDASVESIVSALRTLAAPLVAHAENEERSLFPGLEPSMGGQGGPLAMLVEEHETIHGQIDELVDSPTRQRLETVLDAFQRLLRGHIDKEEQVLFPAASQILGDTTLEKLDRDLKHAGVA